MRKFALLAFILGALIATLYLARTTASKISPLPSQATNTVLSSSTTAKEVAGFYPYWNLDMVDKSDLSQLTTVYYFAVDLNPDGSFNTQDPGYSRLSSPKTQLLKDRVLRNGSRWGVTLINLDASSISKNVNNPIRRKTIIQNTLALMKANHFTALNIDLEYIGDSDPSLTSSFTTFVSELTSAVHQEIPGSLVSFDAFADSVKKPRIFDMKSLGSIVDQVIIMAYDIHRLSSLSAGPVSPLYGKEKYEYDVTSSVSDYLTKVDSHKVILGVPFYGYEWPTETDQKNSFVVESPRPPEISSYHRSLETAQKNDTSINFDEESKSAWFSYFDKVSNTWRQVWFENARSLGVKFDLVQESKLGGIAIFALGYDGADASPLWNEVKIKLK